MHQMRSFQTIRSVAGLSVLLAAGSQFAVAQGASDDKPVNLEAGDKAPVFEGVNVAGKKWKSGDVVGKKYLVVYFYPADFTTGQHEQGRQGRRGGRRRQWRFCQSPQAVQRSLEVEPHAVVR